VDVPGEGAPPGSGVTPVGAFAPGTVLGGKYRVEQAIGEGGLGIVLKARHLQLDQPVAIKHLKPFAVSRADVVERFVREARLAARIKSDHAVKVHDVDVLESGIPYMVMELLEGRDLDQIVTEEPLEIDLAIDYVLQASEALAEAHAAGIVHRDLKPGNLFLASRPGNASILKVLDFGISKVTSEDANAGRVTRIDERIGTPVYMSPEQLQNSNDVDVRSDIWSLGVVLYELVTGKLPFDGPDLPQICAAILTKPAVPLSAVYADATPELEAIIDRCLQKDRAKRYQNIAELAHDLTEIWDGESPSRVMLIARVIGAAGQKVNPPAPVEAPPAHAPPPPPPVLPAALADTIDADEGESTAASQNVVEDHVIAVFSDAAGKEVDVMQFLSIDEAYDYADSLEAGIARCDLYDEFAGVRGRLRVTYVRKPETGHWVPLLT
jgi:eukaryotic-like serine/threonine-protein kinase